MSEPVSTDGVDRDRDRQLGNTPIDPFTGEEIKFQEGFTWKTALGAMFIGFIMMPGAIYLGLVAGMGMGPAAQWVTIVLFTEVSRRSFTTLRKQEVYILFYIAGGLAATTQHAMAGGPIGMLIWQQYFLRSPQAAMNMVEVAGGSAPLYTQIPEWVVPSIDSVALAQRTLFSPEWLVPIALLVAIHILSRMNWLGLGYFLFRLTSDVERLEFPMAPVAAQGATALAEVSEERESWRWRVFSIGAMIGLVWGVFYIGIPTITGSFMTKPFTLIPIPFIDLTSNIEHFRPACIFGINTDLYGFLMGFVLPWPMVAAQFATSMVSQLFINPLLYTRGLLPNWEPGQGTIIASISVDLNFWMSVGIGGALTVALLGIVGVVQALVKSRKSHAKRGDASGSFWAPPKARGDFHISFAIGLWLVSTLGYVIIVHRIVPLFPIMIVVFYGFLWTPLTSYISARMFGITGQGGINFPYVKEGTIILSGYKGVDIWYAPMPLFNWGGVAQNFREIELTGTRFTSVLKAELFMAPVILLGGFLFWSLFWKTGSIPSPMYPYAQQFWPKEAVYQALWNTANQSGDSLLIQSIKPAYVAGGAGAALGFYGLLALFRLPVIIYYGMLAGVGAWPHATIPMFIGGLFGRYYFQPRFGRNWKAYAPVLLAGYGCGMGLVGMGSIALALIAKTVSYLPF